MDNKVGKTHWTDENLLISSAQFKSIFLSDVPLVLTQKLMLSEVFTNDLHSGKEYI